MYNKKFFQKHFALTPMQADDYAKAFQRICYLLQDYDPLHRHRRNNFYDYEKEALLLLCEMPPHVHLKQEQCLLEKIGFLFIDPSLSEAPEVLRKLRSIADCYIWPAYVYEDRDQATVSKPTANDTAYGSLKRKDKKGRH